MGKIKLFLGASILLLVSGQANAAPILITQTIYGISDPLIINGSSQTVSGNWIFSITSDTDATDRFSADWAGNFEATVTLTQSNLGFTDELITNAVALWQSHSAHLDLLGWAASTSQSQPWTRTEMSIINPNTFPIFAELTVSRFSTPFNGFGWSTQLLLENGTTIGSFSDGLNMSMSLSAELLPSPIPAPPAIWLFGIGIIGFGFARRKVA